MGKILWANAKVVALSLRAAHALHTAFRVTIHDLLDGTVVKCPNLAEILQTEASISKAFDALNRFIAHAATFEQDSEAVFAPRSPPRVARPCRRRRELVVLDTVGMVKRLPVRSTVRGESWLHGSGWVPARAHAETRQLHAELERRHTVSPPTPARAPATASSRVSLRPPCALASYPTRSTPRLAPAPMSS
jgi:hypothetical protein